MSGVRSPKSSRRSSAGYASSWLSSLVAKRRDDCRWCCGGEAVLEPLKNTPKPSTAGREPPGPLTGQRRQKFAPHRSCRMYNVLLLLLPSQHTGKDPRFLQGIDLSFLRLVSSRLLLVVASGASGRSRNHDSASRQSPHCRHPIMTPGAQMLSLHGTRLAWFFGRQILLPAGQRLLALRDGCLRLTPSVETA